MNIHKTKTLQNITTRALYLAMMVIIPLTALAQNARITASAPQTVGVGQQFQVQFNVNAEHSNFKAPSFKGLNTLGGPYSSHSSSTSFINGRRTSSMEISYTYVLSASSEGRFTIGSASCVVDGKTISSEPVTITANKSAGNHNQNNGGGNAWGNQRQQAQQPQRAP